MIIIKIFLVHSKLTDQSKNICIEDRVQVLESTIKNHYEEFNVLIRTLNDNQEIIKGCIHQCLNGQELVKIQNSTIIDGSKTDYDRQNLSQDVQCENEVLIEQINELKSQNTKLNKNYRDLKNKHEDDISAIRNEMNDLMVRFI